VWVHGDRVVFVSDGVDAVEEEAGAVGIYSVDSATGTDLQRVHSWGAAHAAMQHYYPRHLCSDAADPRLGQLVFMAAGRLFHTSPTAEGGVAEVDIRWRGAREGCVAHVVDAEEALDGVALHPGGLSVAITSRGQVRVASCVRGWRESV
jgi:tricorn protease-like protein